MTEQMAQYISEGIRFNGQETNVKEVSDIKNQEMLLAGRR